MNPKSLTGWFSKVRPGWERGASSRAERQSGTEPPHSGMSGKGNDIKDAWQVLMECAGLTALSRASARWAAYDAAQRSAPDSAACPGQFQDTLLGPLATAAPNMSPQRTGRGVHAALTLTRQGHAKPLSLDASALQ